MYPHLVSREGVGGDTKRSYSTCMRNVRNNMRVKLRRREWYSGNFIGAYRKSIYSVYAVKVYIVIEL
jgi:hypothetical protein